MFQTTNQITNQQWFWSLLILHLPSLPIDLLVVASIYESTNYQNNIYDVWVHDVHDVHVQHRCNVVNPKKHHTQWIGLRENLQETIDFPIYGGSCNFSLKPIH